VTSGGVQPAYSNVAISPNGKYLSFIVKDVTGYRFVAVDTATKSKVKDILLSSTNIPLTYQVTYHRINDELVTIERPASHRRSAYRFNG